MRIGIKDQYFGGGKPDAFSFSSITARYARWNCKCSEWH